MDKFFKRTLVGAAVAAAAVSGSANAAISLAGDAVQFYGQAAGFVEYNNAENANTTSAVIESRIGFRGVVDFEDLEPNFVWQIEGGNAGHGGFDPDEGWKHNDNGQLGARDTYLGFDWEGFGSVKFGRQLVAAYNYVDWPHTNPGLGDVFDWNNDIGAGYQDRADNVLRYDSANFGGFNVQATLSGMEDTTDAMVASIAGSYSADLFSVHAGYYSRGEYDKDATTKSYAHDYLIVGGSLFLGDFTFTGGYKAMNTETDTSKDNGQDVVSLTAAYQINDKWFVKAGYSASSSSDFADDIGQDNSDQAITGRVGYLLPSAILYVDIRDYEMRTLDATTNIASQADNTKVLFGAEYYF